MAARGDTAVQSAMAQGAVRVLAISAWAAAVALSAPALAQTGAMAPIAVASADPFTALVGKGGGRGGARRNRAVQRYVVAADGRAFLVEGRVGEARLKFLCGESDPRLDCKIDPDAFAEEVFIATGVRGPRGDVIYKDESGAILLRLMSYGGATVFWPGAGGGEAASKSFGDDAALSLPRANHQDAVRRAARATARISALTGEAVVFDAAAPIPAPGAAPAGPDNLIENDASVLSDAIVRVAAGMTRVAQDPTGARILGSRVNLVRFTIGSPPRLSLNGARLDVVYDPASDAAGRPSSRAVAKFLEDSL